ncbi:hypothetical protein GZH46_00503, partial [Fragariocoptes setiger]
MLLFWMLNDVAVDADTIDNNNNKNVGPSRATPVFFTTQPSTHVTHYHQHHHTIITVNQQQLQSSSRSNCNSSSNLHNNELDKPKYPNNTILAELSAYNNKPLFMWPCSGRQYLLNCKPITEQLAKANLSLTVEECTDVMSILTNDIRFNLHLALHRRLFTMWYLIALISLFGVFMSGLESLVLGAALVTWLVANISGLLCCRFVRSKLDSMLERAVEQVNTQLVDHNLMIGVLNKGGRLFSMSKTVIMFVYFELEQCCNNLESLIEADSKTMQKGHSKIDYSRIDASSYPPPPRLEARDRIVSTNNFTNTHIVSESCSDIMLTHDFSCDVRLQQLQRFAKKILLRYSQRWFVLLYENKLQFNSQANPRHMSTGKCLCQFIEEYFRNVISKGDAKVDHHNSIGNNLTSHNNSDNNRPNIFHVSLDDQRHQEQYNHTDITNTMTDLQKVV